TSLYRALLRKCGDLRDVGADAQVARGLVQRQFRSAKNLDSPTRIVSALKGGREAYDLLHSCADGNKSSILRLNAILGKSVSLVSQILEKRKAQAASYRPEDHTSPILRRRAAARAAQRPEALRPHPDTKPITSRPRPAVSGVRHVPVFVVARGIPFLRIKKPQPPSLRRALKSFLDNRWKRIERRDRLDGDMCIAESEDVWDQIVGDIAMQEGVRIQRDDKRDTWKGAIQRSLYDTNKLIWKMDEKTMKRARDMWNVVLKEKALKEKEDEERMRQYMDEAENINHSTAVGKGGTERETKLQGDKGTGKRQTPREPREFFEKRD
ncbi:hypothetical protein KEM55_003712, partial [Ascosphaera atra]